MPETLTGARAPKSSDKQAIDSVFEKVQKEPSANKEQISGRINKEKITEVERKRTSRRPPPSNCENKERGKKKMPNK